MHKLSVAWTRAQRSLLPAAREGAEGGQPASSAQRPEGGSGRGGPQRPTPQNPTPIQPEEEVVAAAWPPPRCPAIPSGTAPGHLGGTSPLPTHTHRCTWAQEGIPRATGLPAPASPRGSTPPGRPHGRTLAPSPGPGAKLQRGTEHHGPPKEAEAKWGVQARGDQGRV